MTHQKLHFLTFPDARRPVCEQLDLFDFVEKRSCSYNFVDIGCLDQVKLFRCIEVFGYRAILDIRSFPSFDRPRFEHRSVLAKLDEWGVYYLPAGYAINQGIGYREVQRMKSIVGDYWSKGPLMVLHEDNAHRNISFDRLRSIIGKRFVDKVEMHPRALNKILFS